jgi:prepilin-type N-terminal cleavage/methylation domain-containing protein
MRPRRDRSEAGLTLIEVMVVILLTAILSIGLYAMTAGQSRTYVNQLSGLNAQQSVWGAMEYLQRQIRLAGLGFTSCQVIQSWGGGAPAASQQSSFTGINDCNLYSFCKTGNCSAQGGALPTNSCHGVGADGIDSFAVGYSTRSITGSVPSVRLGKKECCAGENKKGCDKLADGKNLLVNGCSGVAAGDLLLITTPGTNTPCSLLQATGKGCHSKGGQMLEVNPSTGINPPGNTLTKQVLPLYSACTSQVVDIGAMEDVLKFSIDNSGPVPKLVQWRCTQGSPSGGGTPCPTGTMSDLEVVADGIEDLQISWACDTNGDGVLSEGDTPVNRLTDEWYFNTAVAADTDPCINGVTVLPVKAVRITLVARTPSAEPGNNGGFRPPIEDRPTGTPAQDRLASGNVGTFRRAILTSTIKLRNVR